MLIYNLYSKLLVPNGYFNPLLLIVSRIDVTTEGRDDNGATDDANDLDRRSSNSREVKKSRSIDKANGIEFEA